MVELRLKGFKMGNRWGTGAGLYARARIFKAESQWIPADLVVKLECDNFR